MSRIGKLIMKTNQDGLISDFSILDSQGNAFQDVTKVRITADNSNAPILEIWMEQFPAESEIEITGELKINTNCPNCGKEINMK